MLTLTIIGTILGSSAMTTLIAWLLNRKKAAADVELSEIQQAKLTMEMAFQLAEEEKKFYQIRTALLEQEVAELKLIVSRLEKELVELRRKGIT